MRPVRLVPAAVVLLALGAIAAAAQLTRPGPAASSHAVMSARQVAVSAAVRACPPVAGGGQGHVAFIAGSASAPASSGQSAGTGLAELAPLPLASATPHAPASAVSQADPGVLRVLTVPAAPSASQAGTLQGWSVVASGAIAPAMEAEEADSSGLASVRCGEPGSDIWFVGPGQLGGAAKIQLDLMNIDSLAASVDVSIITDAGPVQAGDEAGVTVPPHQTVTDTLSAAAGGSSVVAIEVRTSIGRVAADVSESSSGGATASWLPSATAPSTRLVIPGVPPSGRAAGLYIVVPGGSAAQVSVLAITSQEPYRPFGTQTVDLPADSASYVPLPSLGGTASALELTANVPVTAAVLVPGSGLGVFTAATAPISEQAIVAGNTAGATIVLSAPAGAARVRLTEIAAAPTGTGATGTGATGTGATGTGAAGTGAATGTGAGTTGTQVVSVRAGHTLTVQAAAPADAKRGSAFAVVITPLAGSGPLYAARVETQGQSTVVSIIPAVSALTTLSLPPVRDSYDAISP
jgi:Family of unknown function (DUF5719)